jgi:hypothetical protein
MLSLCGRVQIRRGTMDKRKVTAEEIVEVISILDKATNNQFKIYSLDPYPFSRIKEEIKDIPKEADNIVCGYEFTRDEYEKIKDYVDVFSKREYEWLALDTKISIDGNELRPTWYITDDKAVMTFAIYASESLYEITHALEKLLFIKTFTERN